MLSIADTLGRRPADHPLLIGPDGTVTTGQALQTAAAIDPCGVEPGTPVALIGGYDAWSLACLMRLLDHGCMVLPLSPDTSSDHQRLFKAAGIRHVARAGTLQELPRPAQAPALVTELVGSGKPGLMLCTAGTAGPAKIVLHDLATVIPDQGVADTRVAATLRFDHLGGMVLVLGAMIHAGTILAPPGGEPVEKFQFLARHKATHLPATVSFLRQSLRTVNFPALDLSALRHVQYGGEPVDAPTLRRLREALPSAEIHQVFSFTELGQLTLRNRTPDSLHTRFQGGAVSTQIIDGALWVRAPRRMLGYLDAPDPFDSNDFIETGDRVDMINAEEGLWLRILGRRNDLVTVNGEVIDPVAVEDAILTNPLVSEAQAIGRPNPISGDHIELSVVADRGVDLASQEVEDYLASRLPRSHIPARIRVVERIHLHRQHKRQPRNQGR